MSPNPLLNAAMRFIESKGLVIHAENMPGLFRIGAQGPELTTNQLIGEAEKMGFQPFRPDIPLETRIILALSDITEPAQDVVTALAKRGLCIVELQPKE